MVQRIAKLESNPGRSKIKYCDHWLPINPSYWQEAYCWGKVLNVLQLAKEHIYLPKEMWCNIIWTDESNIVLFGSMGI